MDLALAVVGIAAGMVGGGLAGYRIGSRVRGRRREYWALNVAAVLGCAALDFAGLVSGRWWLAYSALGLMGGLITGMKYGYADSMRVWRDAGPADAPANAPAGVFEDERADPAEEHDEPVG